MFAYVTAKNVRNPFLRHSVYLRFRGVDPYGTGGTCPPPNISNIYEGGTSMVMSPQYFRSDVV